MTSNLRPQGAAVRRLSPSEAPGTCHPSNSEANTLIDNQSLQIIWSTPILKVKVNTTEKAWADQRP